MDGAALATPQSESDISETTATSGDVLDLKSIPQILSIPWYLPFRNEDGTITIRTHKDNSVKEIICTGVLEFVPGKDRGVFMDECYRILADDGKMTVTVPYWNSWRAYYDARFEWPPFCEQSFLCYNKSWREANLKDLKLESDFDFNYGYAWDAETIARNDESRAFWTKHYTNSVDALQLTLTKRAKV